MITGSIVALVSPMHEDGAMDWDCLSRLINIHIEAGTSAIVAVGTTGESATISFREHDEVLKFVVNEAAGRIPVIAGTGANSTQEAIELTTTAKEVGADAALLVTPYYNKPTQEGLYQHHKLIAETVAIPQILYNVPGRTACDMLPETVERLSAIENIIGIKEATGDIHRARDIVSRCGDSFAVYSGDDSTFVDLILAGGHGNVSVTANLVPKQMSEVCAAALAGDQEKAMKLNQPLLALHKNLFIEANPIPVKWAMHEAGMIGPGIRLPLTGLDESCQPAVRAALKEAGVI